jgi:hypothetical protein
MEVNKREDEMVDSLYSERLVYEKSSMNSSWPEQLVWVLASVELERVSIQRAVRVTSEWQASERFEGSAVVNHSIFVPIVVRHIEGKEFLKNQNQIVSFSFFFSKCIRDQFESVQV